MPIEVELTGVPIAKTKDNLPLCEYIYERRKFMKITPSDLSFKTGIPIKYIKKMEAGEWADLPPGVYVKGFLKKYARVVGLDEGEVSQRYEDEILKLGESGVFSSSAVSEVRSARRNIFKSSFLKNTSFRTIVFLSIAILILIYIGWQFSIVFRKPNISVSRPSEDILVSEPKFLIEGKVSAGDALTINGEAVYADKDGNFNKEIELLSGLNVLEIKAVSRFGKESKITRRITYQQ